MTVLSPGGRARMQRRVCDRGADVLNVPVGPAPVRLIAETENRRQLAVLLGAIDLWKPQNDAGQIGISENNVFDENLLVPIL